MGNKEVLIRNVYLVIDKQTKLGMGTIDEAYVNNNNNDNDGSDSEVINGTKFPTMIPSTVHNNTNLTASETVKNENLNRLKYESSRLLTFDKWPASAKVEPRKIAKAGFFYTGQYAEAKCLWCDYVITTWEYGDQVMTRHRSASPDCPFVRDVSDNIPLLASSVSSSNIMHSDDQLLNNESNSVDQVDDGRQTSNGNSTNSNTDNYNESMGNDEVGDERISDNTRQVSSPRQRNDQRMTSPPQRQAGRLNFHPNSGRPLPEDYVNRPTASSPMSPDVNDGIYKYESERLKTFDRWPLSYIRPADLANAGFVYTGRGDCVRCVFCQEHVGEWDEDDFPHTEHRSLFPHCPFVRGLDVGNIASNAESREAFERLGLVHSQSQHEGLARSRNDPSRDIIPNRSHEQRFRRNSNNIQSRPDPSSNVRLRPNSGRSSTSYQRQHSDQPQRPRSTSYDHSNPPLYDRNLVEHSGRPQSMMFGAGDMMEESFDEAGIRPRYNGPEKGVLNINTTAGANRKDGGMNKKPGSASSSSVAGNPEDIGIIRHSGPANAKYSTVEARKRTFREWPPALRQQPDELSEAGFFYIGLSDQVKCFYCDGGLRNWQPEDDPWTEHARWFSECGFVRLVKGDEFISKCINALPPVPVQGVPVVSRDRSRNTVSEDELQKMMSSPLVNQVLAMGIDSTKIKIALKKKMQETGSGFEFANDLVEATVLQAQDTQTANQGASQMPAALSLITQSLPSQQQVPLTESLPHPGNSEPNRLTTESLNRLAHNVVSSNQHGTTHQAQVPMQSSQTPASGASATISAVLEAQESTGPQVQPTVAKSLAGDKNLAESSEDLELENRRLKDQRTCKICMDREIGVVFLPCGHLISCVQCAPALKDCPLCRQPIHGTVKTYMS